MQKTITTHLGPRGTTVIPKALRTKLGLEEGALLLMDEVDGALRVRKAVAVPVETYTRERKAEFLLNNAVDEEEYREAVKAVRAMGLDPATITHARPG